jgi:exonuclease SbcC
MIQGQVQTSVTTLTSKLDLLRVEISACENACLQTNEQLKTQTQARADVASILQDYRFSRSVLFEGQPLTEVDAALVAAVNRTKSTAVMTQSTLLEAKSGVTRAVEAVRQAELQFLQHRKAVTEVMSNLETWLGQFNAQSRDTAEGSPVGLEALGSLLQVAPEWIVGERERLQQFESGVTTARAVLDTHHSSRTSHEAEKADIEGRDELKESLLQLATAITAATEALSELKLEIVRDDERLLSSKTLRGTIDKQYAVSKVWAQLSELIGSADGKKFRNFAQQLTLDIFLQYGNLHLHSLTRRYRLQRIKDSLGLLVVDQDMGDEVRSVHSLSGGESFLVSLALALGLASLSSHRVRVESLFIDEGFGSLDADSLGIAMDALDNLQSLGRKVGVISHVQEMTDRIGTRVQVHRQSGGLSRILVS